MVLPESARAVDDEDDECPVCGAENSYALYDGDKVCSQCAHVPSHDTREEETVDEWTEWQQHRAERYSGWYGEDRIKFVGGFASVYHSTEDF
jgi:hypothetical protein